MNLVPQFQFSQSSLQDYIECPRRFELRYILKVKWPAPITEPVIEFEHHIQQGIAFHQMVQQHLSAVPFDNISASAADPDLDFWWKNFQRILPTQKYSGDTYPEYRLSIPFLGFRLVAQYDLIILDHSGDAVIFDWKTSRVHPKPKKVLNKVQSRLYPFLLVEAGLQSAHILPEQIKMIYWYPNFPAQPDEISYAPTQYQKDKQFIQETVENILGTSHGMFELTPDIQRCSFCNFRSLCNRGEKAGNINALEDEDFTTGPDHPLDLDFNSIPEISF